MPSTMPPAAAAAPNTAPSASTIRRNWLGVAPAAATSARSRRRRRAPTANAGPASRMISSTASPPPIPGTPSARPCSAANSGYRSASVGGCASTYRDTATTPWVLSRLTSAQVSGPGVAASQRRSAPPLAGAGRGPQRDRVALVLDHPGARRQQRQESLHRWHGGRSGRRCGCRSPGRRAEGREVGRILADRGLDRPDDRGLRGAHQAVGPLRRGQRERVIDDGCEGQRGHRYHDHREYQDRAALGPPRLPASHAQRDPPPTEPPHDDGLLTSHTATEYAYSV